MIFPHRRSRSALLVAASLTLSGVLLAPAAFAEDAPASSFPMHCYLNTQPKDATNPITGVYRGDNGFVVEANAWGPDFVEEGAAAHHVIRIEPIAIPASMSKDGASLTAEGISNLMLDVNVPLPLKVEKVTFASDTAATVELTEVNGMGVLRIDASALTATRTADGFVFTLPDLVVDSVAKEKGRTNFYFRPGTIDLMSGTMTYSPRYPLAFAVTATNEGTPVEVTARCAGMRDSVASTPNSTNPDLPAPGLIASMEGEPQAPETPSPSSSFGGLSSAK